MEDIREIQIGPMLARIDAIAAEVQAKIHQESVARIRWMVGAMFVVSGLVFSILEFTH